MKEKEYKIIQGYKKRSFSLNERLQEKEKFVYDNLIKKSSMTWIEVYEKALDLLKEDIETGNTAINFKIKQLENELEVNKQRNLMIENEIEDLQESLFKGSESDENKFIKEIEPYMNEYREKHDGKFDYVDFTKSYFTELHDKYNKVQLSKHYGYIFNKTNKQRSQMFVGILSRHEIPTN